MWGAVAAQHAAPEREESTAELVVANLLAELERICADGSWDLPGLRIASGKAARCK